MIQDLKVTMDGKCVLFTQQIQYLYFTQDTRLSRSELQRPSFELMIIAMMVISEFNGISLVIHFFLN